MNLINKAFSSFKKNIAWMSVVNFECNVASGISGIDNKARLHIFKHAILHVSGAFLS